MSAKDMVIELKKLAEEDEIQKDEVPEIKTIEEQIIRYLVSLRKELAEQKVIGKLIKDLKGKVVIVKIVISGRKDNNSIIKINKILNFTIF